MAIGIKHPKSSRAPMVKAKNDAKPYFEAISNFNRFFNA